jgi:hypothetical protein
MMCRPNINNRINNIKKRDKRIIQKFFKKIINKEFNNIVFDSGIIDHYYPNKD